MGFIKVENIQKKSSYKIELYGEKMKHNGEEFETLLSREIYKNIDLAERSISNLVENLKPDSEIRISQKIERDDWKLLDVITYNK